MCLPVTSGIADILDAGQAILNGDAIGAGMNTAGWSSNRIEAFKRIVA